MDSHDLWDRSIGGLEEEREKIKRVQEKYDK